MMGWIGTQGQLEHYLAVVGADRDEEGRFLIWGRVVSFLGSTGENAEVVVDENAEYSVGGCRANLAGGLNSTSYGLKVKVI